MCDTCKELFKLLEECIESSCDECNYHEYSTVAISDYCTNDASPKSAGWMSGSYGCSHHSKIKQLKEKYLTLIE